MKRKITLEQPAFLPTTRKEAEKLKWLPLDIIIISGDAYVDHPSFAAAIIARNLVNHGYKVGIIDQPDINSDSDFSELGIPMLYFGISSGNMDSMVNHYTAQRKIRSEDAYSPDGKPGKRPDRALIKYSQKIRSLFSNSKIVLGGIEASLRRIPHYDFWSDKVRNSILFDSRADILVYGMGENTSCEIADRIKKRENLCNIPGTVCKVKTIENSNSTLLPELKEIKSDKKKYYDYFKTFIDKYQSEILYQKFSHEYLRHNPPANKTKTKEIDSFYSSPFSRKPHPKYKNKKIPAFEQIKFSINSHRGCFGGCNFCAIGLHQGKSIQSRSEKSIIAELKTIISKSYFKGSISDIGGPSANMYKMNCSLENEELCKRRSCLFPTICKKLNISHKEQINLLKKAMKLAGIRNIFISSGIRFDLSLNSDEYIKAIAEFHVSGQLKLAPEHVNNNVLKFMYKPTIESYEKFCEKFYRFSKTVGKTQYIIPYIMVGHPGTDLKSAIELYRYLKKRNIRIKQVQEFTPTPMSISSCMYYTEIDFDSGEKIHVPKGREIRIQKALAQWFKKDNARLIKEAFGKYKS